MVQQLTVLLLLQKWGYNFLDQEGSYWYILQ